MKSATVQGRRGWMLVAALAVVGCQKKTAPPVAEQVAQTIEAVGEQVVDGAAKAQAKQEARQDAAEHGLVPYPYTAQQIADSWVTGLVVRWKIIGEGGQVLHQRWEIGETDDEGVQITYFDTDPAGEPLAEGESASNTWEELRNHASFPADRTTVDTVELETPFGTHTTTRYTVAPEEEGGPVKTYWFGEDTPGAPLLHQVRVGEELVMELKMTQRSVEE